MEKRDSISMIRNLLKQYYASLDSAATRLNTTTDQNANLVVENEILETNIDRIVQARDSLTTILGQVAKVLDVAQVDAKKLKVELAQFEEEIQRSEGELTENKQAILQLRDEVGSLKAQKKQLETENSKFVQKVDFLEEVIIGAVIVLILTITYFWPYKLRQANKDLKKTQKALETNLIELPHRVKNNLQDIGWLIRMQYYELKDPEAKAALEKAMDRIEAISLLHQHLYSPSQRPKGFTTIDIKTYVEELLGFYKNRPDAAEVRFDLDIESIDIEISTAMNLGLLINEIVSNAFKYALPFVAHPVLSANIHKVGPEIFIKIQDNGPGITQVSPKENGQSSGMGLIQSIIEEEGGSIERKNAKGTCYDIRFPLKQETHERTQSIR